MYNPNTGVRIRKDSSEVKKLIKDDKQVLGLNIYYFLKKMY